MAGACRSLLSTSRLLYSSPTAAGLVTQSRWTRQASYTHGHRYYSLKRSKDKLRHVPDFFDIRPEVADAVATKSPVVALESTIYTHGKLGNDLGLEDIVRKNGAVPAVCGILDGVATVGLTPEEVERMIHEGARKVSRRDLAFVVGQGLAGNKMHGGTTISGTMVLARLANIRVFGTGGLGGVHRGGESSLDISADLTELGRTRMAVIASGCKGFLDIPRTLEYLETQGALVATFADGRPEGEVDFPAFWARDSGVRSPAVVRTEKEAAAIIYAQQKMTIMSGMLFANPIPEEDAIPRDQMQSAIETAVCEAEELGYTGAHNTPHILYRIRELTGGASVSANKALVRSNVARAAKVAVELSKLLQSEPSSSSKNKTSCTIHTPATSSIPALNVKVTEEANASTDEHDKQTHKADILVAGSVALDLSCDYAGSVSKGGGKQVSPALHTSNPASISQSIGGVGHNVALAAHRVSGDGQVRLCSMVGDDIAGSTILSAIQTSGLDPSCIRTLGVEYPSARTAQYVSVNDADKNLMVAMADMAIFSTHSFPTYWDSAVSAAKPRFLVVDANFSSSDIFTFLQAGKRHGALTVFEPVSAAKSRRLFPPLGGAASTLPFSPPSSNKKKGAVPGLRLFPHATIDLATPNQYELEAMYTAARENEYFSSTLLGQTGPVGSWFSIIDAFGIHGGARDKFDRLTSQEITNAGIPLQAVSLLPYIPTILTKLGANGALLTQIMRRDDERLKDPTEAGYILCRTDPAEHDALDVGGVYMRMYPAVERVPTDEVVSVNGVGDTFLGVLVAGLNMGGQVQDLVDVAQRAAVLTLKSRESVSLEVAGLRGALRDAAALLGRSRVRLL